MGTPEKRLAREVPPTISRIAPPRFTNRTVAAMALAMNQIDKTFKKGANHDIRSGRVSKNAHNIESSIDCQEVFPLTRIKRAHSRLY
jgi:hypothetical protein